MPPAQPDATESLHAHRTITALVQDQPGVLTRIAAAFRRRGFNIASLTVGSSEKGGLSRMTFVVEGTPEATDTAAKQLGRLVEVVEVSDITSDAIVWRELALIKVRRTTETRSELSELGTIFRARVIDIGENGMTFEVTGSTDKINSMIDLLRPFGLLEVMRTGRVATRRCDDSAGTSELNM